MRRAQLIDVLPPVLHEGDPFRAAFFLGQCGFSPAKKKFRFPYQESVSAATKLHGTRLRIAAARRTVKTGQSRPVPVKDTCLIKENANETTSHHRRRPG
jgi:hypothetical protein